MLSKPVPAWVLCGGFFLASIAGSINAVGFLGVHHQALAHMSGPLTILGTEMARFDSEAVFHALVTVLAFFSGCTVSAVIIGPRSLRLGRRYGVVLMLEALLLATSWWLLSQRRMGGESIAAFACGLQNAMATSYSGAVIRTTHMTGIVTDLGVFLGHMVRREPVDTRRAGLYGILLIGFVSGCVLGSYGFIKISYATLLIPAALTGLGGAVYTALEQRRRYRSAHEHASGS